MAFLRSLDIGSLRSAALGLIALAFLCWLGVVTSAYSGHPEISERLLVGFGIFGFSGAFLWVVYGILFGIHWLRAR